MIINFVLTIISFPLYILGFLGGVINLVLPTWMTSTITNVIGGSGILNTVVPMYPHAGLGGLAGTMGLMTIFGWWLIVMGYLIILSLGFKLIKLLLAGLTMGENANIGTGGR